MQITTQQPSRVVAVLGPTNTGKTHLAMERMLGHASGMIGFPLRLLARENYDRAVAIKGRNQVALITGEEKIVPGHARYFVCTVEAMPLDRRVSFLAVDEVQMCADPDRGHVFTERLLGARGEDETMLLGADTVKPLLRRLVPEAEIVSRPRFSVLAHAGARKITRLAPRSAVVAFSAADVYSIAELVRRQRGGAAVVLGALSPRTRNAQVAMYQAGEVDYLVATDAIGMGLNMDVDHVAFAAARKFDGRLFRELTAAELAQIAGRAGRHMNDGTFGTTADSGPLDPEVVERIENHRFEPLRALNWRNPRLRFTSLAVLMASLALSPETPGLVRAREADDELALKTLAKDSAIADMAATPDAVRLLWEVCGIPDFQKTTSDAHWRLLGQIYRYLMAPAGRLPADWVAEQVARTERTDGDIETLVQRLANVRTWTYVSFRGAWLDDAGHWRERTRAAEDRLSDALHERLTQRFVDRRAALLVRRGKDREPLVAVVGEAGDVSVEGHFVGRLDGFLFIPDGGRDEGTGRAVTNAARRALKGEIAGRLRRLEEDGDDAMTLDADGRVLWRGMAVARLARGPEVLRPRVETLSSDLLDAGAGARLRRRLEGWLERHLGRCLAPLMKLRLAELDGAARGIAFRLCESLGSLPRKGIENQIAALGREGRRALRGHGVKLGRESIFLPALIEPAAVAARTLLWAAGNGLPPPPVPPSGRISVPVDGKLPPGFYEAVGYRRLGGLAVRVDMVERLAARAWSLSRKGPFAAAPELLRAAGCGAGELTGVLAALGYRAAGGAGDGGEAPRYTRAPRPRRGRGERRQTGDANSPFAKLRRLTPAP